MSKLIYVGVGSSRTPESILDTMSGLAEELAIEGFTLRCGNGGPADDAFERGALAATGLTEVHIPRPRPCGSDENIVSDNKRTVDPFRGVLPHWSDLSDAESLTARTAAHLVLGSDLRTPSLFLITWTPDGAEWSGALTQETGRSAASIALCSRLGIPVFNLKHGASQLQLRALMNRIARGQHPERRRNETQSPGRSWRSK